MEGWAVGDYATLLHFKNGLWQKHEAGISADWLTAVKMNADLTAGFAMGKRGDILRYENGKWQPSPETKQVSATLTDLWLNADSSEGWAVGQRGEVWQYSTR